MVYNSYGIKRTLSYIKDSFNFNDDDWKTSSIEFIGSALEIIGCSGAMKKTIKTLVVTNYRTALPDNIHGIIRFTLDGKILPILDDSELIDDCKCDLDTCSNWGELNPNYLHTSFETGTVKIVYYTIEVDADGFPMIPNDALTIEAIGWWVTYKLMLGGNKHHTLSSWHEPYQMWEKLYPQAQNSMQMPDVNKMKVFASWWLNPTNTQQLYDRI